MNQLTYGFKDIGTGLNTASNTARKIMKPWQLFRDTEIRPAINLIQSKTKHPLSGVVAKLQQRMKLRPTGAANLEDNAAQSLAGYGPRGRKISLATKPQVANLRSIVKQMKEGEAAALADPDSAELMQKVRSRMAKKPMMTQMEAMGSTTVMQPTRRLIAHEVAHQTLPGTKAATNAARAMKRAGTSPRFHNRLKQMDQLDEVIENTSLQGIGASRAHTSPLFKSARRKAERVMATTGLNKEVSKLGYMNRVEKIQRYAVG